MSEDWKSTPSEPNYEASSLGRIRRSAKGPNTRVGRVLKFQTDRNGYLFVSTSHDGLVRRRAVSHLVAEAFIGKRPEGMVIRHIDGDSSNNRYVNLQYGTQRENILDKHEHGTMMRGEKHCRATKNDSEMLVVIRDALRIGQKPAARLHGVDQATIWRILHGKSRAYLLERL